MTRASTAKILLLLALLLAPLAAAPGRAAAEPLAAPPAVPLTVVELYTSQGCSSCPPADAFLGELVRRDDLLALSLHVDYWDYIGWKDPFASPANTMRQRDYARALGMRYVYTPQMVIQGADHATGSDRAKVLGMIAKAPPPRVRVGLRPAKGGLEATVAGAKLAEEAAVWLVMFERERETAIRRGENGGRTLKYHNVVRTMTRIGTWTGKPLVVSLPLDAPPLGASPDGGGCAVIVQALNTGRILGAAKIDLPGS